MNAEERLHLRALLRDIWVEFRASYYEDDQEIITYLAYLLTKDREPITKKLRSQGPRPDHYRINESKVEEWLAEAGQILRNEGGLATFFDRYILFQPTKPGAKDAYPIPRHIIDFMLGLLSTEPSQSLADFACGTGGVLVHWHKLNQQHGLVTGVDISPEMARLADANAVLHGMTSENTIIELGDAFAIASSSKLEQQLFDRIVMAPSFGRSVDPAIAERLFGPKAGRNSELLFVRLALKKLKNDGIAVVMVPPGMGFTNASQDLRRSLVEEHTLRAVITLDERMLRPFASQQVSLWLMEKQRRNRPGYTWFLKIANDGYPLTANRDLTADPSDPANDLLATTAVMSTESTWHGANEHSTFWLQEIRKEARILLIKVREQATLSFIRYFSGNSSGSQRLVIQSIPQDRPSLATIIPFSKDGFALENTRVTAWTNWESGSDSETESTLIFSGGKAGQMIALTTDGRLLGFTKSSEEIAAVAYQLTDSTYRDVHQTQVSTQRNVAQSLHQIGIRQRIIAAYSESLLGQLEIKSLLKEDLPPALLDITTFPLLAYLDAEQQAIWDELREKKIDEQGHALHFIVEDISGYDDRRKRVKIDQTLQLLEALGLIVQVSIKVGPAGNERPLMCYRRVTTFEEKKW